MKIEIQTKVCKKIDILKLLQMKQSSYSSSSSYSVGTVLTKPSIFKLRMRLLQYATTTQDREN